MANADIIMVGPTETTLITELYNQVFAPKRDVAFFERRFKGRCSLLNLIAEVDHRPVGFLSGFELKPSTWFNWLVGVLPDFRRLGIASQLCEAEQAWARDHGYHDVRMECHNQHRAVLQMCIRQNFDIVGIRFDADRQNNLVIFEKEIGLHGDDDD
ncbi:MAG TPA: GNAT family N-acetyltransferase [Phycisphaerae bacterium]|nr:GNAT family N-acetyltransferase [Phycisphaerales bacterium]HNO77273.1 GNAT family N-acetyltransferase [Phycisphaerae bacterium]